jgi:hypothetical protein
LKDERTETPVSEPAAIDYYGDYAGEIDAEIAEADDTSARCWKMGAARRTEAVGGRQPYGASSSLMGQAPALWGKLQPYGTSSR